MPTSKHSDNHKPWRKTALARRKYVLGRNRCGVNLRLLRLVPLFSVFAVFVDYSHILKFSGRNFLPSFLPSFLSLSFFLRASFYFRCIGLDVCGRDGDPKRKARRAQQARSELWEHSSVQLVPLGQMVSRREGGRCRHLVSRLISPSSRQGP